MSDWLFFKLARHQLQDYWSLQLSSIAFFVILGVEMLVIRRRFSKLSPAQVTDMFYWVLMPQVRVFSRMVAVVLILALAFLFGVHHDAAFMEGWGPVARQPKWLLIIELLLLMDLATYWTHRTFHAVPFLWRYHALHHSAKEVSWATTGRVHPLNEMCNYLSTVVPFALIGFPVNVVLPVVPLVITFALFAHADWTVSYGPFKGILVSPRLHRWHHTHSHEGGNKNFANVFAFWDRLFGTYYLPADRLPQVFGLDVDDVPQSYLGQFLYPWRRSAKASAAPAAVLAPVASAQNRARESAADLLSGATAADSDR